MVIGGLLSVWASILDGCDGEVARLKLQVSNFGCWLETICDYLYYLFIFVGMSIGLTRSRGTEAYLVWGGALIIGAVVSFLVVGAARHRFASSHPEKFLALWQEESGKTETQPLDVYCPSDGIYNPSLFSPICSASIRSSEHNAHCLHCNRDRRQSRLDHCFVFVQRNFQAFICRILAVYKKTTISIRRRHRFDVGTWNRLKLARSSLPS